MRLAAALLLVLSARVAAQPRIVEHHEWSDTDGRLMGYYSAALAFTPAAAPDVLPARGVAFGLEMAYVPPLSAARRSAGETKTQSTNLAPVLPRPRLAAALPGGASLEASWVPPVKVFGVTANLWGVALSRPLTAFRGMLLTPRIAGSGGVVEGAVTCNRDLERRGGGDSVYFAWVCHGRESEDRFRPLAVSAELVASRLIRGGTLAPYAGLGARYEHTRFDVGVQTFAGERDPRQPILDMHVARGYGVAGASWRARPGAWLSGELLYLPGSVLTVRAQGSVALSR